MPASNALAMCLTLRSRRVSATKELCTESSALLKHLVARLKHLVARLKHLVARLKHLVARLKHLVAHLEHLVARLKRLVAHLAALHLQHQLPAQAHPAPTKVVSLALRLSD